MPDQNETMDKGGTMRLGAYPCTPVEGTRFYDCYGGQPISERHRHRCEFNNLYREAIESKGMKICGISPDRRIVEAVEITNHPFFVGVQFHPEFQSRPNKAHPIFKGFIQAACEQSDSERQ